MNSQIEDVVSNCATCQQHRSCQQKEPLQNREVPDQFKEDYEDLDLGVNEENQRQPIAPDINRIPVRIGMRQRRRNQRDDFLYY